MKQKLKFITLLFVVNFLFISCASMMTHEIPSYSQDQEVNYREDIIFKIEKTYWTNQTSTQTADAHFLVVEMSMTNIGKKSTLTYPPVFTLISDQGYEYEFSDRGTAGIDPNDNMLYKLKDSRLSPLVPVRGKVVFDVPKGNYFMIVSTGEKGEIIGRIYRGKDLFRIKLLPEN